jgi:phytoene desaturase
MPDLFESFFEDFGKKREDYLQIQKLSPSYRIYFKDTLYDHIDVYDDLEKNRENFEMIEP